MCLNKFNKNIVDDKYMNTKKTKQKILKTLSKLNTIITLIVIQSNTCFATGIGTAEVQTATENIKRVITSIAMPLGRCFNICKYSCCSNKNDSKC